MINSAGNCQSIIKGGQQLSICCKEIHRYRQYRTNIFETNVSS